MKALSLLCLIFDTKCNQNIILIFGMKAMGIRDSFKETSRLDKLKTSVLE